MKTTLPFTKISLYNGAIQLSCISRVIIEIRAIMNVGLITVSNRTKPILGKVIKACIHENLDPPQIQRVMAESPRCRSYCFRPRFLLIAGAGHVPANKIMIAGENGHWSMLYITCNFIIKSDGVRWWYSKRKAAVFRLVSVSIVRFTQLDSSVTTEIQAQNNILRQATQLLT